MPREEKPTHSQIMVSSEDDENPRLVGIGDEDVFREISDVPCSLEQIRSGKNTWISHICRCQSLLATVLEGYVEGRNFRWTRRLNSCRRNCYYTQLKRLAEHRNLWRTLSLDKEKEEIDKVF